MSYDEVMSRLQSMASPHDREGMRRFGINVDRALGISVFELRKLAREIGTDHELAPQLWGSGVHEARILASFVEDSTLITEEQMERWVADLDSWDLCDQVSSLFEKTPIARRKIFEWSQRDEEFVRRASFAMIAGLAVHDKRAPDETFEPFLDLVVEQSTDNRNFVKKAVNWALRNIGKRNLALNRQATEIASRLRDSDDRASRWIGSNACRELTSDRVQDRLSRKAGLGQEIEAPAPD